MATESKGPASKAANVLLVPLFLAAIWLPLGVKLLGWEAGSTIDENRVRAAPPELKLDLASPRWPASRPDSTPTSMTPSASATG